MKKSKKYKISCKTCKSRGLLWLHGKDYIECPLCDGAGHVEIVQTPVQARVQERHIPRHGGGLVKVMKVLLPNQGWRSPDGSL